MRSVAAVSYGGVRMEVETGMLAASSLRGDDREWRWAADGRMEGKNVELSWLRNEGRAHGLLQGPAPAASAFPISL